MPGLSLSCLGAFQAHLDDEPITGFQSDKARALLVYLAVEAGQPHRRDRLAGLLWPDWPDANARANLRHALNNLRTVLGDREAASPFLLSDRQTIQFNPDSDYRLDVAEFSRHLDTLAVLEAGRADEQTVQRLQQAVDLYTGPFLSGFFLDDCAAFEEWSLFTRERLQLQLLSALQSLTRYFEQQEDYKLALHYARRRVEFDALQEEAHRHLMRLLALTGQRSAALVQFEICRQLLSDELGVEPNAETIALHQQIQTGQPLSSMKVSTAVSVDPSTATSPPHNLPAQTTRFIGRSVELAVVREKLLQPEVRLLTLTGPGGTGKTRLALQVAAEILDHFPDGVFFVPLAPLRDPELVVSTIAEVLAVRESGGRSVRELLTEYVQAKQLLLMLDNFEHLMAAAPLVTKLLAAAPQLKILVTSRASLRLYGEHCYPVPPLSLPDSVKLSSPDQLLEHEACQLFVDRAQAIKPSFTLTNDNAPTVAAICIKLDGLPLAIELAAARIKLLALPKMLVQLSNRLQFLTRGYRDLPIRHQTLRNTIDWSYELLTPAEQTLFRRLAVFVSNCSLEAAEAVGNISGEIDVFDGLESLLEKSLLRQTNLAGEPRFGMLQTLREYGLERLEKSGEAEIIYQACLSYYVDWVEATTHTLKKDNQERWLAQLEIEHDNLRAALQWARKYRELQSGLRLVGMLWPFWEMRAYITEGRRWLEAALIGSEAAAPALRAEAYTGAGTMAFRQGDHDQATIHHQAALILYRQICDENGMAFAFNNIGAQVSEQGDYDRASRFFEKSLTLARKIGSKSTVAVALHNSGEVARRRRKYERAVVLYEEALTVAREVGDKWHVLFPLVMLSVVKRYLGEYEQAATYLKECLTRSRELDFKEGIAECLQAYAGLAVAQAQPERAARLLGAAEILRETIGVPIPLSDRADHERTETLAFDALGETAFAAAWANGRSMPLEQAITYALENL